MYFRTFDVLYIHISYRWWCKAVRALASNSERKHFPCLREYILVARLLFDCDIKRRCCDIADENQHLMKPHIQVSRARRY